MRSDTPTDQQQVLLADLANPVYLDYLFYPVDSLLHLVHQVVYIDAARYNC